MDQDLSWWAEVVFAGWRDRPGPRYARLAAALLEAIDQQTLPRGTRVPAERTLAAVTGTSRGTVVACFDQLAEAGVLTRRQGAGTYVAGRPSWAARPAAGTVATMLLRRVAEDRETIDLSVSAPGDLRHLPPADPEAAWQSLDGHGLDPAGLPGAARRGRPPPHRAPGAAHRAGPARRHRRRAGGAVAAEPGAARHPGARPLPVLPRPGGRAARDARRNSSTCPRTRRARTRTPSQRAGRSPGGIAYLMPTGHNPTGTVMPPLRRQALAAIADAGRVTVVEDLTLADLVLGGGRRRRRRRLRRCPPRSSRSARSPRCSGAACGSAGSG